MYRHRKRKRAAQKARNKEEKCMMPRCRNRRVVRRWRYVRKRDKVLVVYENKMPYCWKCKSRRLKKKHPATYVLNHLRASAAERKIPFTLTVEQFKEFCKRTGYLEKRGTEGDALTIGRIDHDKGYHIWNIQVETFEENSRKGHTVPGKDVKQNEPRPETYDYDFNGPAQNEIPKEEGVEVPF